MLDDRILPGYVQRRARAKAMCEGHSASVTVRVDKGGDDETGSGRKRTRGRMEMIVVRSKRGFVATKFFKPIQAPPGCR